MRTLSQDAKTINNSPYRQHRWKVFVWETRSTGSPSWAAIIASTADTSYRLDITSFVADGLRIDEPGDRRASRLTMTLVDRTDRFNPIGGSSAKFMRPGCVVRVLEGDAGLAESDWTYTFTGFIKGQVGYSVDRHGVTKQTDVSAYGRRATARYLKQQFISKNYGRNQDYGRICTDVMSTQMGLGITEYTRVDTSLGKVTQFASQQIAEMTPLEAIDKVLETVLKVSDFDGSGIMRYYSRDMTRDADKTYNDLKLITRLSIPAADHDSYNAVNVTGLDKNVTETEQPNEALARATVTVGFWRPFHTVKLQWSDDRSLRAKDTYMVTQTSVKDAMLIGFGNESYAQLTDFDGQITIDISGYLGTLMTLIGVTLAAQAAIGDWAPAVAGYTVPVGKILEGATLTLITTTLAHVSSGQYEIRGTALIPVYKQISRIAVEQGVPDYMYHQKDIRNDFLNEANELEEVAQLELFFEHAQAEPRTFSVVNDLELEIGDIVYIPIGGGLRVWIDSMRKTLSRGEVPTIDVSGYRAL